MKGFNKALNKPEGAVGCPILCVSKFSTGSTSLNVDAKDGFRSRFFVADIQVAAN